MLDFTTNGGLQISLPLVPAGGSLIAYSRITTGTGTLSLYSQNDDGGASHIWQVRVDGAPTWQGRARTDATGTESVDAGANIVNGTPAWSAHTFDGAGSQGLLYATAALVSGAGHPDFATHTRFCFGGRTTKPSGTIVFDLGFLGAAGELCILSRQATAADLTALRNGTLKPEQLSGCVHAFSLKDLATGLVCLVDGTTTLSVIGTGVTDSAITHPVARTIPVPVSFSGPVPTRNGVLGTATTFANAGFFAGNLTPFTYSSVGTALPAGITLNTSTGVLSQAATGVSAGTTSGIIIRATDTGGNIANTNAYSIVIAASNAAPTFPGNISNLSGTAGSAITPVNFSGQFSDTDALAFSASPAGAAWPSGLVVNSSTGIGSGTVASAGTTTGIKVRATDTGGSFVDSNAFNVVIAASSTTRTWTPTIKLEALADETPFANWAIHAVINDMAGNLIGTKTGLTTSSAGLPPSFTSSYGSLATDYRVTYIDDTDLTIFAVENLRCV